MDYFCRSCLKVDKEGPIYPLAYEENRKLLVDYTLIELRSNVHLVEHLCSECVMQCLRWRAVARQAYDSGKLWQSMGWNWNDWDPNVCGVCLSDVRSQAAAAWRKFLLISSMMVWPKAAAGKPLCLSCADKCLIWDSWRRMAIESHNILGKLGLGKAFCSVEVNRMIEKKILTSEDSWPHSPQHSEISTPCFDSDGKEEEADPMRSSNCKSVANNGVDGESEADTNEEKGDVDFEKLICRLCKRLFKSPEILRKHIKLSDLHKQNLAKNKFPKVDRELWL